MKILDKQTITGENYIYLMDQKLFIVNREIHIFILCIIHVQSLKEQNL